MKLTPIRVGHSLVYQTSTGPRTITPSSFAYATLISSPSVTEDELLELLIPPPTPNGVFTVYLVSSTLYVLHTIGVNSSQWYILRDGVFVTYSHFTNVSTPMGTFTSFTAIQLAFPEYFI